MAQYFTKTDMRGWGAQRLKDLEKKLNNERQAVVEGSERDEQIGYMLHAIDELLAKRK